MAGSSPGMTSLSQGWPGKPGHDIGEAVAAFFFASSGLSGLQRAPE